MRRFIMNSTVSIFVVLIVLLLIIPLNPFLIDILIIVNISISLIILLVTMNIREPLEFSIFPSLLLITTLYRLGINVSTTRNILTNGGSSGAVIQAFGNFVLQGNAIVGFIIFLIIVLVQFIVITKGAERVAEVAARFTLDAMPGKQMAIDADLNTGLINEQQAKERRYKIQKEADFYGAMDGATKIVKGDAVMSLIITAINFIAGMVIGMVQLNMGFAEVLSVYSIATIGDGLVSQIPALLISTATGMIVTRSVSEGSLNEDVSKQFSAQPQAMIITGVIVLVLAVVPGMPKLQLIMIGAALVSAGVILLRRIQTMGIIAEQQELENIGKEEPAPVSENDYFKDIDHIYSLIHVEQIEMEFGYSLIPLADENNGGKMINRIVIFRRQYAQEMGFVIPSIQLRDSSSLSTNQYVIKIKGEEVARGEILVDYFLALEPSSPLGTIEGIETIEPAYGIPSKWITLDQKEMAEIYGYTVIDPLSVMITHLSETIKHHAYELLTRAEVGKLIDKAKETMGDLIGEVFPNAISYSNFQKILASLLKEGVPIKDMETILETILDASANSRDLDGTIEQVRIALKRTITRRFCSSGQMRVIVLDSELEKAIVGSLSKGDNGIYLALSPQIIQKMVSQIGEIAKKFDELQQPAVVLTSQVIRVHVYRLVEQFYPNVYVLSFNEIANNVQIQAIGTITK